jgi:hypothetical protein
VPPIPLPGVTDMSNIDDRKLAALAKKNAAKKSKPKDASRRRKYDDTLPPETEEDLDQRDFFSEMKKREF